MANMTNEITGTEKEFLDVFKKLCYSRSSWEVWADLMTVIACSISNSVEQNMDRRQKREKEFEFCIKRLGSVDDAAKLLGIIVMAFQNNPVQDFLGKLYMSLELGSHWKGQFFTPYNISHMMAKLLISDSCQSEIEKKGYITINDPTCGAGGMIIAGANILRERNINYQEKVLFIGQDIDRVVGMMCYIQMSLLGCAGYVVIANTLTSPLCGSVLIPEEMEEQEFWYTPFYSMPVWSCRRAFNKMDMIFGGAGAIKIPEEKEHFYFFVFYINKQEELTMNEETVSMNSDEETVETNEPNKRSFQTGAEKLQHEEDEFIKRVSDPYKEMYKKQLDMVFSELIKKCNEDEEFNSLVLQEHKTWGRCNAYAGKKAMEITNPSQKDKDLARRGEKPIVAAISSEMMFEWIFEYYKIDDKKEAEKEASESTVKKSNIDNSANRKKSNQNISSKESKPQSVLPNKPGQEVHSQVKPKKDIEGQCSLFDLI